MTKHTINQFWVEGDCEKKLIHSLSLIGKIDILDLSERTTEQLQRMVGKLSSNRKNLKLYIVFDTDILIREKKCLERFTQNINFLIKQKFNVYLLQQHRDFEEELCFCLNMSMKELHHQFQARNQREFKSNFIHEKNLINKLKLGKDSKFWQSNLIEILDSFKHLDYKSDDLAKI